MNFCTQRLTSLRLEVLAAEDTDPPYAYIWFPRKKINLDYDAARVIVKEAAKKLLSPEELKRTMDAESGEEVLLYLPAPTKTELLSSFADGDGQGFVDILVSLFDLGARFIPVLDKLLLECLKKE